MDKLHYIPLSEIKKIRQKVKDSFLICKIIADILRINVLYMVRQNGTGHLGSSFSSADIVAWLWFCGMQNPNDPKAKISDIYFSSKGHDVPTLYAALMALEKLDFELIHKLRQIDGLPGHPDTGTPFIAANTGSLGMGISKAKGMALAKRLAGKKGRIYVMLGDGELQEGQIWESLEGAAREGLNEITAIVDCNRIQSDTWTKAVSKQEKLEARFRAFGWEVKNCDGHDFKSLQKAFVWAKSVKNKPQIIIAKTIKGKGISEMEKMGKDGFYKFHSGAPGFELYGRGFEELKKKVNGNLKKAGLEPLVFESTEFIHPQKGPESQRLIPAYGQELIELAQKNKDIVALNADLLLDCGLIPFKKKFPRRLFECGIAEQDMVSMAGGLALQGKLPIVHSFASFLTTRPNEQIYNNATEKKKVIYAGFLAGLIPGTPGHSHQSVRDIACLGNVPGLAMIQPCCEAETKQTLRWAVESSRESVYIRLVSIAFEVPGKIPQDYVLKLGQGVFLKEGKDAVLISYGPVMLGEAIKAAELLEKEGKSIAVLNLPWLNRLDEKWLTENLSAYQTVFTLDDHYKKMGQGEMIAAAASRSKICPRIISFGVDEIPFCGRNGEVLQKHGLDAESLAKKIGQNI